MAFGKWIARYPEGVIPMHYHHVGNNNTTTTTTNDEPILRFDNNNKSSVVSDVVVISEQSDQLTAPNGSRHEKDDRVPTEPPPPVIPGNWFGHQAGPRHIGSQAVHCAAASTPANSLYPRHLYATAHPKGLYDPRVPYSNATDLSSCTVRRASVLVPLCFHDSHLSILFTVRSSMVSSHKHQAAFPGGHAEPGEGVVETALRETNEEVGIREDEVDVVGVGESVRSVVSGTIVVPVLGILRRKFYGDVSKALTISREVESTFCLRVDQLLNGRTMRRVEGEQVSLPCYHGGPRPVWGMTAYILDAILQNVVKPVCPELATTTTPSI
eukprot:GHVS01063335.1.p1 GENE.GHVS01063335.1~~GHVS01063335.1.p1  ORF type:complete len:326 (+),score=50.06 GHVS01063335.1:3-980(+)